MAFDDNVRRLKGRNITRRSALKGLAAATGAVAASAWGPGYVRYAQAQSSEPIRIGFQVHRTGIGASYGRWYERTTTAAAKLITEGGGIGGRPIEIIAEDDGTDPKRGAEVVEKFATQHKADVVFGTLFSHVVIGSAPRAGELKLPYFVVSEGHHVASGALNRYVFQPGITDVKSQVISMAPWIAANLGKKVTMIFPDFAFGHDHRDYFSAAIEKQGGKAVGLIAIPPTESSFTRYFPQIPADTEVLYHVMVGRPCSPSSRSWGNISAPSARKSSALSIYWKPSTSPRRDWSFSTAPISGRPIRAMRPRSRASTTSSIASAWAWTPTARAWTTPRTYSTFSHMFGCWETLYIIKKAMEEQRLRVACRQSGAHRGDGRLSRLSRKARSIRRGAKLFNGKIHQSFGHQHISKVEGGKLNPVHRTTIEEGLYEPEADYTKMAL